MIGYSTFVVGGQPSSLVTTDVAGTCDRNTLINYAYKASAHS
jgi:hypothetical protein